MNEFGGVAQWSSLEFPTSPTTLSTRIHNEASIPDRIVRVTNNTAHPETIFTCSDQPRRASDAKPKYAISPTIAALTPNTATPVARSDTSMIRTAADHEV